jgi:hypothetical protein
VDATKNGMKLINIGEFYVANLQCFFCFSHLKKRRIFRLVKVPFGGERVDTSKKKGGKMM